MPILKIKLNKGINKRANPTCGGHSARSSPRHRQPSGGNAAPGVRRALQTSPAGPGGGGPGRAPSPTGLSTSPRGWGSSAEAGERCPGAVRCGVPAPCGSAGDALPLLPGCCCRSPCNRQRQDTARISFLGDFWTGGRDSSKLAVVAAPGMGRGRSTQDLWHHLGQNQAPRCHHRCHHLWTPLNAGLWLCTLQAPSKGSALPGAGAPAHPRLGGPRAQRPRSLLGQSPQRYSPARAPSTPSHGAA